MNFHKPRAVIFAAIAAVSAGIAFATPASAALSPPGGGTWDHIVYSYGTPPGATLYIKENGDILEVCDTSADGKAATAKVMYMRDGVEYEYTMTANGGYESCTSHNGSDGALYNLPENTEIFVALWTDNYDSWVGEYYNDH